MKTNKMYGFASMALTDDKLKKIMKHKDFIKFINLKNSCKEMEFDMADKVATAIKKWAISMNATHYTHWFFPLTGKYAEKQISFLDYGENGTCISKFNGLSLIKWETDASSFPSGGERMTFEARGYTVWDYTSPVFIKADDVGNRVLYIPTAFCTFNGVALDEKTPLLRACDYLNKEATHLLHLMGLKDVKQVYCNVGAEQEYFLIDKNVYENRMDLKYVGRSLIGADALKSQEISRHYLGQITPKVSEFMHDLDRELWKLGIMAKIQHNEVAPSQHEIVPIFTKANIASDQNALMMDIMDKVASKHGLKVLFDEKPFKGVNGSGKHNNWSLSTDTGINLLDAKKVDGKIFMTFFVAIISAIDKHYDLLKMSTATLSNDFRMGGHEAPPSIVSVYIGDDMLDVIEGFKETNKVTRKAKGIIDFKTTSLIKLHKDRCDRNRTSPFAYTGNKFEFRMVGASQDVALSNIVLCTIVAEELREIAEELNKSSDVEKTISNIIIAKLKEHSRIIFNGNSYDKAWEDEASKRGLKDYKNCVECYDVLLNKDNIKMFENSGVMDSVELKVRYDTYMSKYIDDVLLSAKTLYNMCKKEVIPNLGKHILRLSNTIDKIGALNIKCETIDNNIEDIVKKYTIFNDSINVLYNDIEKMKEIKDIHKKAIFARDVLLKAMEDVRCVYDEIEIIIPNSEKPFPDYNDILFK